MDITKNIKFILIQVFGTCPKRQHSGDAGYDLTVSRDIVVPAHSFVDVHTDVAVIFPDGVWGRITGRSSTLRRRGLLVTEGIIDNGYTGELFTGVYNLTNEDVLVKRGERIAQLVPHMLINLVWSEGDRRDLLATGRGSEGFGSTGA